MSLVTRPDPADALCSLSAATLYEIAGRRGALPSRIKPVVPGMRVAGTAFPVRSPGGDNLWLHRAIAAAPPQAVLVASVDGAHEFGHWGEVMSWAATARRLGGLVLDGGVRDYDELGRVGFPVFATNVCMRATTKDPSLSGALGDAVEIGGVRVRRGDIIVGDADGVVCLPADGLAEIVDRARSRVVDEQTIIERLEAGDTTMTIYGLPAAEGQGR